MNELKILLGYNYFPHPVDVKSRVEAWLSRLRREGFDVWGFPLSIKPPSSALPWQQIDSLWKRGDVELLRLYEDLAREIEGYDVFLNCNGVNLHPEFVQQLPSYNIYACFDDPESSEWLSRPVAASYDIVFVGNIACLDMYRDWGVNEVHWWPIGFHPNDFDPSLTKEKILSGERDVDISLLCERTSSWRNSKLEVFTSAFPSGEYYGKGWPRGFLPESKRIDLFQRTKIGPNFHNSTGPVNSRTYVLPANGVMQICDNKNYLSEIYELGKEVVGFSTIEEAIDLCRYYMAHDRERREIAAAGWEKAHENYNEVAVFNMMVKRVHEHMLRTKKLEKSTIEVVSAIDRQRKKTIWRKYIHRIITGLKEFFKNENRLYHP